MKTSWGRIKAVKVLAEGIYRETFMLNVISEAGRESAACYLTKSQARRVGERLIRWAGKK